MPAVPYVCRTHVPAVGGPGIRHAEAALYQPREQIETIRRRGRGQASKLPTTAEIHYRVSRCRVAFPIPLDFVASARTDDRSFASGVCACRGPRRQADGRGAAHHGPGSLLRLNRGHEKMTLAFLYSAGTNLGAASVVPAPRMASGTDMLPASLVGFLTTQRHPRWRAPTRSSFMANPRLWLRSPPWSAGRQAKRADRRDWSAPSAATGRVCR
jgi:hypothetical protein